MESPNKKVKEDSELNKFIKERWYSDVLERLQEYIKIPNMSPYFDKEALTNGLLDQAMELLKQWVLKQNVKGMSVEVVQDPNRTPLLLIQIDPSDKEQHADVGTTLIYGHMDKQPPFEGWNDDLGPYKPVIKDGKLYGRGGADDGYSVFCAVLAVQALQKYGKQHGRVVIIIEAGEESGSPDLVYYVNKLRKEIGRPNLVICLDSGCLNYEQLWVTSSLRGVIGGNLKVETIREGIHSGDSSGVVPGTFRILRQLISRLEDEKTGEVTFKPLQTEVTGQRLKQVEETAKLLGKDMILDSFPFLENVTPVTDDPVQMALNRWWKPQLVITGQKGIPDCSVAGSVMRPTTTFTLSMRLPPSVDADEAFKAMKEELLRDPPYNAKITFDGEKTGNGFCAPEVVPWLADAIQKASQDVFGKPGMYQGEGGSIPFMGDLLRQFPEAQFCVIGLLGPHSNPHGPNEFMHIEFSCGLSKCVASILADHFEAKYEKQISSK